MPLRRFQPLCHQFSHSQQEDFTMRRPLDSEFLAFCLPPPQERGEKTNGAKELLLKLEGIAISVVLAGFGVIGTSASPDTNFSPNQQKQSGPAQNRRARSKRQETTHPDAVEKLITALKSHHHLNRTRAAEELGRMKDPRAVEALIQTLNDELHSVRVASAEALRSIGSPSIEPLTRALRNPDPVPAIRAAYVLTLIDRPAVESLIAAFRESPENNDDVRLVAKAALAKIGEPAVERLIAALNHTDRQTRSWAASTLGEMREPRAVEPLIRALSDSSPEVRSHVAKALGEIKDPRVLDPLLKALNDTDRTVQAATMRALGALSAFKTVSINVQVAGNPRCGYDFPFAEVVPAIFQRVGLKVVAEKDNPDLMITLTAAVEASKERFVEVTYRAPDETLSTEIVPVYSNNTYEVKRPIAVNNYVRRVSSRLFSAYTAASVEGSLLLKTRANYTETIDFAERISDYVSNRNEENIRQDACAAPLDKAFMRSLMPKIIPTAGSIFGFDRLGLDLLKSKDSDWTGRSIVRDWNDQNLWDRGLRPYIGDKVLAELLGEKRQLELSLFHAISHWRKDELVKLFKAGIDPNTRYQGMSALEWCLSVECPTVIENVIREAGTRVNK
jgi:HEAT repeat protein